MNREYKQHCEALKYKFTNNEETKREINGFVFMYERLVSLFVMVLKLLCIADSGRG